MAVPAVLENLEATHTQDSITLTWDEPADESITTYHARIDGSTPMDIGLLEEETWNDLENNTAYLVEVRAVNAEGEGPWAGLTVTTDPGWPNVPRNLAETHDHDSITITWQAPLPYVGPPVTSYRVWIGNSPEDPGTFTNVGLVFTHTFTGLESDHWYSIQVQAINSVDGSYWEGLEVTTEPQYDAIVWGDPDERYYHTGTDKGVLYTPDGAVAWNGVTGVTEAGQGPATVLYRDGVIYHADVEPSDYTGSLTAYFWPDLFSKCLGIPEIAPGFHIDNQRPTPFGLSYRSLIGSGTLGDMFGYQIHLVYNAVASIGSRSRKTLTNSPEIMEFSFDLVAKPVKIPGFRPSSHFIIDTRNIDPAALATLETILYGDGISQPALPTPADLFDILSFGSAITFVDHGDGTWTATGSAQNLIEHDDGTIEILNVNGTDNGDGTYILEDTP